MKKLIYLLLLLPLGSRAQSWISGGTTQAIITGNKQIRWNFGTSGFVYGYTKGQVDSLKGTIVSGVSSAFGRTGAVSALVGDYSTFYLGLHATADNSMLWNSQAINISGLATNDILQYNGSAWQNVINTYTSPLFHSAGNTSIQVANTSQGGYLTAIDWNIFNNKQAALGFTPENIANKTATQSSSTTTYPNWLGVTNYVTGLSSVYQPLNTKLTAISALANASGVLTNNGSGGFSYTTPSGTTINAVTFNNGGAGAASGTTFDGSTARTISYNTIGAAPATSGTGYIQNTTSVQSSSNYNIDGLATITKASIGVTPTDALLLTNTASATIGNQKISPSLHFNGNAWNTTGSASESADFYNYMVPVQGATPTANLLWQYARAGGGKTTAMTLSSGGNLTLPGTLSVASDLSANGINSFNQGSTRGFSMSTRTAPALAALPVISFRPTTANTAIAFDIMPNGTASDFNGNGVAWADICDADVLNDVSSVALRSLRLAANPLAGYMEVGSKSFNGGTLLPLSFTMNGTVAMQILANRDVTMGSTPVFTMTAAGVGTFGTAAGTNGGWITNFQNPNAGTSTYTRLNISAGSAAIGTLDVFPTNYTDANFAGFAVLSNSSGGNGVYINSRDPAGTIKFGTASTEVARILPGGFLGLGYTADPTSGNKLGVNGNIYAAGSVFAIKTTEQGRFAYSGAIYTSFTTNSSGNFTIAPTGGTTTVTGALNISSLTASQLVATDASKNLVSTTPAAIGAVDLTTAQSISGAKTFNSPFVSNSTITANSGVYYAGTSTGTTQINGLANTGATNYTVNLPTANGVLDLGFKLRLTGSGTGAATTISIAHGLTGVTSSSIAVVTPINAASAGISYVTTDATNVNIVYTVAPASGTNNLSYNISIKP